MASFTESVVTTQTQHSSLPVTVPLSSGSPSLFHHSLVTKDSELLKFHAAAALQLKFGHRGHEQAATSDDRLIVSPYNDEPHLLDLKRYDVATQLLAKALTIFKPIREDYATAPYLGHSTGKQSSTSCETWRLPRATDGRDASSTLLLSVRNSIPILMSNG